MTEKSRRRTPNPSARALELLERARRKAAHLAARDPESVHGFRTALRRLRAQLWLHRDLIGRRPGRRLRRELGRLVRETGRVRDAQAGRELMAREKGREESSLRSDLAGEARLSRPAAKRLRRTFRAAARELKRRMKKAPAGLDGSAALRRLRRARRELPAIVRRAVASGDADLLHEARKRARTLRYAEESLFPRGSRDLKRLQDALGRERDLSVLEARARREGLAGLERRLRADRNRALRTLRRTRPRPSRRSGRRTRGARRSWRAPARPAAP